jgi:hypothetical protein
VAEVAVFNPEHPAGPFSAPPGLDARPLQLLAQHQRQVEGSHVNQQAFEGCSGVKAVLIQQFVQPW